MDVRIGHARCPPLGQELDYQLDALSKHGIPRDRIFSEISSRTRVRPKFEEALRTAREVKAHAPHCRVIITVYEMKRLGRDAAELTALADHLTAHGLVLEMPAGPPPGIYDPTGPGKLLFAFFAAMAETERENIRESTLEGSAPRPARASTAAGRPSSPTTCRTPCSASGLSASPSSRSSPTCSSPPASAGPSTCARSAAARPGPNIPPPAAPAARGTRRPVDRVRR
ncbi:recombinase family protein, partial [Streptomyces sp. NPDC057242]|uniref:recombinase family protein n=2 Tax=unclassified Streptomyces TaxID=2593676 RepID=UPI00363EA98C